MLLASKLRRTASNDLARISQSWSWNDARAMQTCTLRSTAKCRAHKLFIARDVKCTWGCWQGNRARSCTSIHAGSAPRLHGYQKNSHLFRCPSSPSSIWSLSAIPSDERSSGIAL